MDGAKFFILKFHQFICSRFIYRDFPFLLVVCSSICLLKALCEALHLDTGEHFQQNEAKQMPGKAREKGIKNIVASSMQLLFSVKGTNSVLIFSLFILAALMLVAHPKYRALKMDLIWTVRRFCHFTFAYILKQFHLIFFKN